MRAEIVTSGHSEGQLRVFLASNKLPAEELVLEGNLFMAYYDDNGILVGYGGLEFNSHYSLLRSIVVSGALRNHSRGREIVADLIQSVLYVS
jgi:hypothetical protein